MANKAESGFIEIYLIIAIATVLTLSSYLWRHIYNYKKIDSLQVSNISKTNSNLTKNFEKIISDFELEKNINIISNHNTTIRTHNQLSSPIISTSKKLPTLNWNNFITLENIKLNNNINLSLQTSLLNMNDLNIDKLDLDTKDKEIFLVSLGATHIKELNINKITRDVKILYLIAVESIIIENIILSNNLNKILIYSALGNIEIKGNIENKVCNIHPFANLLLRGKKLVVNSVELDNNSIWSCKDKELFKIFPEHRIIGYQG